MRERREETGEAMALHKGRVGESTCMPPRLSEQSPPFVLDATQEIKLHASDMALAGEQFLVVA